MRWLADECTLGSVVAALREAGHDVIYAAEDFSEADDADLADIAMRDDRLVLTEDRDFGRIVFRNEKEVPGIIYLRFSTQERALQWPRLKALIATLGEGIRGHFIVLDKSRARIRPLPDV